MAILQDTTKLTHADMLAMITKLQAENQALAARTTNNISFKVSEKGAISVLGLQRFPVTLYAEQWARVLARKDDILAFAAANKAKLSTKAAA